MEYITTRQYLGYVIAAMVGYVSFGPFDYYFVENSPEGLFDRLPIAVMLAIGFIYVLRNRSEPTKIIRTFYIMQIIAGAHYLYILNKSGAHTYYVAGGYLVLFVVTSLIFHTSFLRLYLVAYTGAVITIATQVTDSNYFARIVMLYVSFSIFIYIFQNERIKIFEKLNKSVKDLKVSKKQIESTYSRNLQVAHDLGSPVSAINAVADKLKYENPTLFRLLDNSVARINEISGDLLKDHRAVKSEVEADFFDLENSISRLIEDKRKEYSDIKNLFIFYRVTAPILREIKVPKSEFHRVMSNMMNNCVDAMAAKAEKRIKLVITPEENHVEILISDNGKGIPPEYQTEIFKENVSFKEGGTGIGLSDATTKVKNWGGYIKLKSSSAEGSCFQLVLPYS